MQKSAFTSHLAGFFPGYFAFVMATGIVSIAAHFHGREWIALGLFWLNNAAFLVLWVLTLMRLALFPVRFVEDLTHHSRGAAFLTKAAGSCVLGSGFVTLTPWSGVAKALWFLGFGLWWVLSYTFFAALTFREPKPSLEAGITGSWLLVIVATESISVLGTLLAPLSGSVHTFLFVSLVTFLVGAMLYVFFATLILYRWMFFSMHPERLTPDYWIDMGALAITTLAGALLIEVAPRWSLLEKLTSFLTGSTLFFWATATWWIPLLSVVELWRHLRGHVRFQYEPQYWALVFPLGMYAVASFMMVRVTGLAFFKVIAAFFTCVALLAWAIVFLGMLFTIARLLFSRTVPVTNSF